MTGAHRGTTHIRVAAAGAATTLGIVLLAVAAVAVMVLALYFGLTRQADAQSSVVALQSVTLLLSLGSLISLLRKAARSPEWLVAVIAKAGLPAIMATSVLFNVGRLLGWNDSILYAIFGISGLAVVSYLAYSFGGERRLLAVLRARAASRERRA